MCLEKAPKATKDDICRNCAFWMRYYQERPDGVMIPAIQGHGFCFRSGRCGVREGWLSCEKFVKSEEN